MFYPAVPRPNHRRPADNGSCVPACIGQARRTRSSTMQRRHRGEEDAEHVLSTRAGCRICRCLIFFCRQHSADRVRRNDHIVGARRQCRGWETDIGGAINRTHSTRIESALRGAISIAVVSILNHCYHNQLFRCPTRKGLTGECTCGRPGCITGVRVAAIQAEGRRTRLSSVNRS